jgi:aminocarboxymuconate-semialdehyde decarboxylase
MSEYYFNNLIGNPLESTLAIGHLIFSGTLDRHPGLKICVAHGGGYLPGYWGRMDHGWRARGIAASTAGTRPQAICASSGSIRWCSIRTSSTAWSARMARIGCAWVPITPLTWRSPIPSVSTRLAEEDKARILGLNAAGLLGLAPA